jgi:hypothetical protein
MKLRLLPAILIALACLASASLQGQTIRFRVVETFSYPGAISTLVSGIDDAGNVVGGYLLAGADYANGFERYADGTFSDPIIHPGSGVYQTFPMAIDNNGTIAGWYSESAGTHGFFLNNGVYTSFDYPGAIYTFIEGINDAGDFVGRYTPINGPYHGFASIGGNLIEIAIPGATYTEPTDINNRGEIVGWYNTTETTSGFLREANGTLHYPFRPPGNTTSAQFFSINDRREIVGHQPFACLYYSGGNYFSYTFRNIISDAFSGINRRGTICGTGYDEETGIGTGYLVKRVIGE